MVVSKPWQHCKSSSEQLNCIQLDQFILRKIVTSVATRCHILRLKCTKLNFGGKEREQRGGTWGINLPNGCLKNLAALQKQQ